MSRATLPKWWSRSRATDARRTHKRKRGATSLWEVPRRPKFHRLGCGCGPVRRYNDGRRELFPAKEHFPVQKGKGTRPAGCLKQRGYQGSAPTAELERVLSVPANGLPETRTDHRRVGFQTAVRFCQCGVARLLVAPSAHLATHTKKAALDGGSQVV